MNRVFSAPQIDRMIAWIPALFWRRLRRVLQAMFFIGLMLVVWVALGYGLWPVQGSAPRPAQHADFQIPAADKRPEVSEEGYVNAVSQKDLFQAVAAPSALPVSEPAVPFDTRWNFLGVLSGDSPQAIFENKLTMRTYYLMPGQSAEDLSIEKIDGTGVWVLSNGQRKRFSP